MIAAVITASSCKEAKKELAKASKQTNLAEIRADFIKDLNEDKLRSLILSNSKIKKIVTIRKKAEGGKFKWNEKKRIMLLKKAIELKADYVDVELSSGEKVVRDLIKVSGKTKVIVSYHNFKRTNKKELEGKVRKIKRLKPDMIKVVSYANSINDNKIIFDIIKKNKNIIALCMGEKGEISRILGVVLGNKLTYASLGAGKESAPGQLTVDILKNAYKIGRLRKPKIYGLVGNPEKQSKGYILHNKKAKKSIYVNFLVEDLGSFIRNFKGIFSGLSITIPFKREVIKYIDEVDPLAKKIGAVNTIVKKGNKLVGYNTDCRGAIKAIEKKIKIKNKDFLIIGAGGAARAIAFGIRGKGGNLIISNRTVEKAKKLAKELGCAYTGLNLEYVNVNCLINTTSVGMYPDVNKSPIEKGLLKSMVVFDSVYNPRMTKLLKDARSNGCKIICGDEMFINQALEQQRLWGLK